MTSSLDSFKYNRFSQNGEDGIIEKVFEIIPKEQNYWCVEFGAWDGKYLSNTYKLLKEENWKGILIEGNSKKFVDLQKTYENSPHVILLNKYVSFDGGNSLDNILKDTDIPVDFHLLSIDIDGNDYHVWDSLKQYQPKLVVIEFNPTIPGDVEFVQEKNMKVNQGNSLLSLVNLGKTKGYELIAATHCNAFFIDKNLFHHFNISDNSVQVLWKKTEFPRVFQLYDGTLVLSDGFYMIWHNYRVKEFDIQVFPKFLRKFYDSSSFKHKVIRGLQLVFGKFRF